MEVSSLLYVTTLPCLVTIGIVIVEIKYFEFIMLSLVQRVVWLTGLRFCIVSHNFAKFKGHSLCDRVIQLLKWFTWPCKNTFSTNLVILWKKAPHYISHPAKIDSHKHFANGYVVILVCHVILQHSVIICLCDIMVGVTQGKSSSFLVLWPLALW